MFKYKVLNSSFDIEGLEKNSGPLVRMEALSVKSISSSVLRNGLCI